MVAEATVLIFCGNWPLEEEEEAGTEAKGGSLASSIGPKRSLVASSILSQRLTGGFSVLDCLSAVTTMPSDSDLLTRLLKLFKLTKAEVS